ncbi:4-aminobutyrate--2-oxoglutarate transaminase [Muricauda ruestringensis]|uniref:4-aminobutyrate--2-oxoglutarate transaminase n=1 Tax=Flagellimonas aurea TaxID=2915619 RepID=A0ABS3GAH0_9FLAO|nr:4-aminobutyrate--2-oxoglutarate transaminase [Allomuricauda aurea]MBO0356042.1 4-aminobutyrate--2-oxoglutarate transaminase [Allomuricauda aurea]
MTNLELQKRKEKAIARGQGNLNPIFIDHAKNAELWDVEGKRYIDFGAGIAVVNTGHVNNRITKSATDQLGKFVHAGFMITPYEAGVELAEKLNELVPIEDAKTMIVSTGAEAVENAIKIAKAYTKRSGVIAFHGGFHGRTHMGLGLTGKISPYKKGFGPFPNNIFHVPFPIPYYNITIEDSFRAMKNLFTSTISPDDVAAIILEPVQGEGGFNIAPPEFLSKLRELCTAHGILLICDEIQTGFARTGTFFATEQYGIEPDLMTLAKGLAGGFPLSAVVGKREIMDASENLGGTFAGSPVACAAALEVIDIIKSENLCDRANEIGKIVTQRLLDLQNEHSDVIGNVRNKGAMIAVEFVKNGDPDTPNPELAKAIVKKASENGLIILMCGIRGNAIRILTPLTIDNQILDEGLRILEESIVGLLKTKEYEKSYGH